MYRISLLESSSYIPHLTARILLIYTASVGVMGSVLVSCAVRPWILAPVGQTKDYNFGIFCFCANHATLRRKIKA